MKIALINPPHPYLVNPNMQAALGLAYLSAMVKKHKPEVQIDILNQSHLSIEEAVATIDEYDVFGYTATCTDHFTVHDIAKKMRERFSKAYQILGGPHATLSWNCIDLNIFDAVFRGEAEYTLLDFLDDAEKGLPIEPFYVGKRIDDLNKLPFPDRAALGEVHGGQIFVTGNTPSTVIMGSRGCPYKCAFCASEDLWTRAVRWRNIDALVSEIKHTVETLDIRVYRFSDDNMTSRKGRLLEFCKKVEPLNIEWRISARVDTLPEDLLLAMRKAGLREINLGVESFDPEVLKKMSKDIVPEQSIEAIKRVKDCGIIPRILFMISTPGETYKRTVDLNIEAIEQIKNYFDSFSLKTLVPLPGTPLWNRPEDFDIEIVDRSFEHFNFYMYERGSDGKPIETEVYSNIRIKGMTEEQQIENIIAMRKYVAILPQNNKG